MPNTGLKRDLREKFYTKIKVANQCIADFKKHIKLDKTPISVTINETHFIGLSKQYA